MNIVEILFIDSQGIEYELSHTRSLFESDEGAVYEEIKKYSYIVQLSTRSSAKFWFKRNTIYHGGFQPVLSNEIPEELRLIALLFF